MMHFEQVQGIIFIYMNEGDQIPAAHAKTMKEAAEIAEKLRIDRYYAEKYRYSSAYKSRPTR
ncbi:MAG: hypothetical protein LBL46_00845 [Rickettsiales bacterium]|jgi:hypothetical protein|nr:hypothetical protein [Rickettsiales bacterium]